MMDEWMDGWLAALNVSQIKQPSGKINALEKRGLNDDTLNTH